MKICYKVAKKLRMIELSKKLYFAFFSKVKFEKLSAIQHKNISSCKEEYIVSLTSWQPRFKTLPITLKSLLLQKKKPDRIILWFGNDVSPDSVPEEIKRFEKKGVEIKYVDENLRAHKKYYYTMKENPDSNIITVDDDVVYSPFTISSLINANKKNGGAAVCARRAHKMAFKDDILLPYDEWEIEAMDSEPRYDLFGTGVGGILYPPHCLHPDLFDKEALKIIAFTNDDFWLKGMELLQGTPTKAVNCLWKHPISIEEDDNSSLYITNVLNKENDKIVERLQQRYPKIFSLCINNAEKENKYVK